MGRSDSVVFPLHVSFIVRSLVGVLSTASRVAWLGQRDDYPVSTAIRDVAPPTCEHHFFDINPALGPWSHRMDINEPGWGSWLSSFDVVMVLRVTPFVSSSSAFIRELEALTAGKAHVVIDFWSGFDVGVHDGRVVRSWIKGHNDVRVVTYGAEACEQKLTFMCPDVAQKEVVRVFDRDEFLDEEDLVARLNVTHKGFLDLKEALQDEENRWVVAYALGPRAAKGTR